jgi:hypothetical protein
VPYELPVDSSDESHQPRATGRARIQNRTALVIAGVVSVAALAAILLLTRGLAERPEPIAATTGPLSKPAEPTAAPILQSEPSNPLVAPAPQLQRPFIRQSSSRVEIAPEPIASPRLKRMDILSDDDWQLLRIASCMHYVNNQEITPGSLSKHEAFLKREIVTLGPRRELAQRVAIWHLLAIARQANWAGRDAIMKTFSSAMTLSAIKGLIDDAKGKQYETLRELYDGQVKPLDVWLDQLRFLETMRARSYALSAYTGNVIADSVEALYGSRMNQAKLDANEFGDIAPLYHDEAFKINTRNSNNGVLPKNFRTRIGLYARLSYKGNMPLTNVIIIGRISTTTTSEDLSDAQRDLIKLNKVQGFEDKADKIEKMFKAQNLASSMPKSSLQYIEQVNKGDIIQIGLGNVSGGILQSRSITLYSDQGQLCDYKLPDK